jgi:hypothetical protein
VWFDPVTYLPTQVILAATDETLTLDYTVAATHWVLSGFSYDGRLDAPREDEKRVRIETSYTNYDFPATVPGF